MTIERNLGDRKEFICEISNKLVKKNITYNNGDKEEIIYENGIVKKRDYTRLDGFRELIIYQEDSMDARVIETWYPNGVHETERFGSWRNN
jgi:hypothetical protein